MSNNYKISRSILLLLLITSLSGLFAQTIPNPGFENWHTQGFPSYTDPDNWATVNSATAIIGVATVEKATGAGNFHSGAASIKLTSKDVFGRLAPGTAVTGTINTNTEQTGDGFIYTQRPDYLVGWFKAAPQQGDTNIIEVRLWKRVAGADSVVATASFENKAQVSTFTKFRLPIVFNSPLNPDSCRITLLSCSPDNGHANSVLFVDDLEFVTCNATASATVVNNTLHGGTSGSVTATLTGGTAPYTYAWSNNATTQTISNLPAGSYCVTITDDNGCSATACGTVTEPGCFAMMASVAATDATTNGGTDGTAEAFVAGGNSGFTYAWTNNATTKQITGLPAGQYCVTVTDNVNCSASACGTVNQPNCNIGVTVSTTNATTPGGTDGMASALTMGGSSPFNYLWSHNASLNTATVTGLGAGNYCVTVTDAVNCSATACGQVSSPSCSGFSVSLTPQDATKVGLADGQVTSQLTGGTGPYTYLWSTGATTQNLTNVATGTYCLTVTDAGGCPATACSIINQPSCTGFSATISHVNVTTVGGNNGSVTVTATGGRAPYTYVWAPGAATTSTINNVPAGGYCVTVTDTVLCTVSLCDTVTQPSCAGFAVTLVVSNVTTVGGSNGTINATITGGNAPYIFQWSNNVSTEDLSGLPVGPYCLTVTDVAGCSISKCDTVTGPSCAGFSLTVSATNATTATSNNGSATATVTGGASPVSFVWNNTPAGTTATINNLAPATYCVTATDNAGCTLTGCDTVSFNVGIGKNELNAFNVFPSPSSGTVTFQTSMNETFELSLFTADGKLALERKLTEAVTVINLNSLANGVYVYRIKSAATLKTQNGRIQLLK